MQVRLPNFKIVKSFSTAQTPEVRRFVLIAVLCFVVFAALGSIPTQLADAPAVIFPSPLSLVGELTNLTTTGLDLPAMPQEQLSYSYDAAQNLQSRIRSGLTNNFQTDSRNQLTNVARS